MFTDDISTILSIIVLRSSKLHWSLLLNTFTFSVFIFLVFVDYFTFADSELIRCLVKALVGACIHEIHSADSTDTAVHCEVEASVFFD